MQLKPAHPEAKDGRTIVIADDLSGAAECASEFVRPGGSTCLRLVQGLAARDAQTQVWDLNARDMTPVLSAQMIRTLDQSRRAYVKIDSLLRGNWAALVSAIVQATRRPVLLCPALPRLGRGFQGGFVKLAPGQVLPHDAVSVLEGLRQAGVQAGHHQLSSGSDTAIREGLLKALGRHPVTVVDAHTDAELDAMAGVLESLPASYVAIGSAGLAGALARALAIPAGVCALDPVSSMAVLVGSRTGPAREQLAQLARVSGEAVRWWRPGAALDVVPASRGGDSHLHLFATRSDDSADPQGRDLTRQFARAVLASAPGADCFVATGGETARALCDALGLDHLDVVGQLEPGVSLARMPLPGGVRHLVIKSGSFGDPATLVRIARMGGVLQALTTERQA